MSKEVPFHVYDKTGTLLECVGIKDGEEDPFLSDPALYAEVRKRLQENAAPLIMIEDSWVVYIAFFDQEQNLYIGGPADNASAVSEKSRAYQYRRNHHLPQKYLRIPKCSVMEMANLLAMALFAVNGQQMDEMQLLEYNNLSYKGREQQEWDLMSYHLESFELERKHIEYDFERKYLDAVREGNVEYFNKARYEDIRLTEEVGKLAEDNMKQYEYMVAVSIALVARAAMEGGLAPAVAYPLSDLYYQKLEKCKNPMEIINLHLEMQKEMVSLVRKHKNRKRSSYYVEQCKDYLAQNIHKHVTVEEIAEQLGVSRTYLSNLFSQQEGMTISQYSIRIRLRAAENMLKYSEASIAEIAEYLCFSSQSHFGNLFKQRNKMTPAEYRRLNKKSDFTTR